MNRYTDYRWLPRVLCVAPGGWRIFGGKEVFGSAVFREYREGMMQMLLVTGPRVIWSKIYLPVRPDRIVAMQWTRREKDGSTRSLRRLKIG